MSMSSPPSLYLTATHTLIPESALLEYLQEIFPARGFEPQGEVNINHIRELIRLAIELHLVRSAGFLILIHQHHSPADFMTLFCQLKLQVERDVSDRLGAHPTELAATNPALLHRLMLPIPGIQYVLQPFSL